jgi:hypothetical protein
MSNSLRVKCTGCAALGNGALHRLKQNLANFYGSIFGHGRSAHAAHRRANARNQLPRAEGLGNVIVRSRFQCLHLVFFLVANREHQDWQSRSKCADAPQRLNAADARHIHIKQNHIHGARCAATAAPLRRAMLRSPESRAQPTEGATLGGSPIRRQQQEPELRLACHVLPFCVVSPESLQKMWSPRARRW